ncbi:helix-turn-helix transcriptional regulator [Spirosoma spitsbergense]|uniref:helix-turn-helix transcriptional regulator n=1 Tax=Spirosoma spitsbergense TaxID=431554 RepID=UPI000376383B|nr:AraC family transcriptional regulator [Spirosoma spitsbergense]
MNCLLQKKSLSIKNIELDQWSTSDQPSDSYTLILVQGGEGYHLINGNQFAYRPGDVFFLGARDRYSFLITQRTNFYWLSFSAFFVSNLLKINSHWWNPSPRPGSITTDAADQDNLKALVAILLSEERNLRHLANNPIVDSLMSVILTLLDRLLTQQEVGIVGQQTYTSVLARRIIAYISQHIGEPDRLRMDVLADKFNYSPGHLNTLFRQQAGESIPQFIIRHKLRLVATRLQHTLLTVSQIADEFGFSDVSHLNKLFKRYYNHTPTTYRQSLLA